MTPGDGSLPTSHRGLRTLVLFDIDGTLVLTGGAGGRALRRTFADLFGVDRVDVPPLSGRTDCWIFAEMLRRHAIDVDEATGRRVREVYLEHLAREVAVEAPGKGVLPGVCPLLDALSGRDDLYLGLLTGNVAAGARIKLEHFDLWRYFGGGGFGDTSPERTLLYYDAIDAIARTTGHSFAPRDTVIIGDTPLDVAVAIETGARSLGVSTGACGSEELRRAGADEVLDDLSDLTRVLTALGIAASD